MENRKRTMSVLEASVAIGLPVADVEAMCNEGTLEHTRNEVGHLVIDAASVEWHRAVMDGDGAGPVNVAPAERDPDTLG